MTYPRRPLSVRVSMLPLLLALLVLTMIADAASAQPINGRGRWCATFPQGGGYDCASARLNNAWRRRRA